MIRRALLGMILFGWASSAMADLPAELQVKLQGSMLAHIDEITVDGAYTYIDTKQKVIRTVYPANVHPMIIPYGDDYFVCSEMVDESGNHLTADFLVRQIGGDYRVVQTIIDDRAAVQAVLAAPPK